jgi:hypothetical protein
MTIIIAQILMAAFLSTNGTEVALLEDFNALGRWKPVSFPKIEAHTQYEIKSEGDNRILTARSHASASAIVYTGSYNPYRYPSLRWRWKVENLYTDADPNMKKGDDYPMRVYVVFAYDPQKADLFSRIKYELAKKIYGRYPPWTTLNYVWASQSIKKPFYDNPYNKRSKMVPLRGGKQNLGEWVVEEVNVLEDYKKIFGEDPPLSASLAIMNDSDDTGQAALSHMDFIEVREEKTTESKEKNNSKS